MEEDQILINLQKECSDLKTIIKHSLAIDASYQKMEERFAAMHETLNLSSKRVAPLQSLSIANKALDTRINRAISPALALLDGFKRAEDLQCRLLELAASLLPEKNPRRRLQRLIEYVECVDRVNEAIGWISRESEPAIQKLQEVVEFLSRTKAADPYRTARLKETLVALKAVCEAEVDSMRFDGVLDEALLNLQDEYEGLLLKLRHRKVDGDGDGDGDERESDGNIDGEGLGLGLGLGSDLEIEVLRRISHTLAANDCLDICIDVFVKVRYRRAAKALMRLNPEYLKTYSPEEIDEMEWEILDTAISLWMQHLELSVKTVLVSEKNLCNQVLGNIIDGIIWPECFIKIADKIMAVFFRFGEGVARSEKQPQKLFKLLDMFDSLEKLKPDFTEVFNGEAGADITARFRELEKLLVHASTRVFWELGLQIEGNHDGLPPPQDGSVPKLVRYAINFLKNLCMESYISSMAQVLKTDRLWKSGTVSDLENDEDLVREAVSNVMEAIQRNIESKKSRYKDKVLVQIFCMNTYWYIYMRTRNTELGRVLGEAYIKKRYRNMAEEAAYLYQKQAWGSLVRLLEREREGNNSKEGVRGKMEAFRVGFDEILQRHKSSYKIVSDADLREQMKEAAVRQVLPAYTEFYEAYSSVLVQVKPYLPPESVESLLRQIFDQGKSDGRVKMEMEARMSVDRPRFSREYRRSDFDGDDDL